MKNIHNTIKNTLTPRAPHSNHKQYSQQTAYPNKQLTSKNNVNKQTNPTFTQITTNKQTIN